MSIFKNGSDPNGRLTRVCPFVTYCVLDANSAVVVKEDAHAAACLVRQLLSAACFGCTPCRVSENRDSLVLILLLGCSANVVVLGLPM